LSKNLNLTHISLKKLIDLKIIEIANAELISTYKKDSYSFNLTVYFNPEYLEKANLFQGTKLSKVDLDIVKSISIGLDAGIASEMTINCGETYSSIEINSRNPVNKNQSNKIAKLKKYQRKLNRHIAKSKKNKKKDNQNNNSINQINKSNLNSIRNNNNGFYTNKFKELKQGINSIQTNMNNHKLDTVKKLDSIMSLFKGISFQDEMVKSWHSNKKMKFSSPIQKGILGKSYAKLKQHYDSIDNKTMVNNVVNYQYKKPSKNLRTTKTCICGIVNKDITLKDRVYVCSQCGYSNDRDTHSSYIINNTLNHVNLKYNNLEYQIENKLGCGKQSKDLELSKNLILNSNLGKTTASVKTKLIYDILSSKLKSQNLSIKLNIYNSLVDKSNQEAPSFRSV
jgi:hypothetical protein